MGEIASLGLCQELYKLSGWKEDDSDYDWNSTTQRYSLGFILRKIEEKGWHIELTANRGKYSMLWYHRDKYSAHNPDRNIETWGDTPEDAACELAIELFKQQILS